MKTFDHLVPLVGQPSPGFDAFYADLCRHIPDLTTPGNIELPPEGFRKALKTAYVCGTVDAISSVFQGDDSHE